jgi:serine/threonine-protein kinase
MLGVLVAALVLFGGCLSATPGNNQTGVKNVSEVSTSLSSSGGAAGFVTYENPTYKIRMQYPSFLTKQEESTGDVVFFLSPQNSATEPFPANVNILVLNMSDQPITLDEFTNQSVEQIRELVPDYNFTDSRKATLAKEDAYLLAYTGTQGLLKLKWMSVYTIKNDTLYLVTYTAGVDKFPIYLSTVSKMLDSFEITG